MKAKRILSVDNDGTPLTTEANRHKLNGFAISS